MYLSSSPFPVPGLEVSSLPRTSLSVIIAFLPEICKAGREKPQQMRQSSLSDRPALSQIKEQSLSRGQCDTLPQKKSREKLIKL